MTASRRRHATSPERAEVCAYLRDTGLSGGTTIAQAIEEGVVSVVILADGEAERAGGEHLLVVNDAQAKAAELERRRREPKPAAA